MTYFTPTIDKYLASSLLVTPGTQSGILIISFGGS